MINSIRISNYRGLDGLTVENFGRFNLITGSNNVGKTALLEALVIASVAPNATVLAQNILRREDNSVFTNNMVWQNYIVRLFGEMSTKKPLTFNYIENGKAHKVEVELLTESGQILPLLAKELGQNNAAISLDNFLVMKVTKRSGQKSESVPLIVGPNGMMTPLRGAAVQENSHFFAARTRYISLQEAELFSKVTGLASENRLLDTLRILAPDLERLLVRVENSITQIQGFNGKIWLPLSQFGDGLSRLASFLLAMATIKNGYVFIDEIENGMHFSVLKDIFRALNQFSQESNIQVFATTHSAECINAAVDIFESEPDEFRLYRLQRNQDKPVSVAYDTRQVAIAEDMGLDVRGQLSQALAK